MTQKIVRSSQGAKKFDSSGVGSTYIETAKVSLKPEAQRSTRVVAGAANGSATAEVYVSPGRKVSVDPRHTGPRKKRGGWPELPPSKSFTLWVPNEHYEGLNRLAHEHKISVGSLVRKAIAGMLKDGQDGARRPRDDGGSGGVPKAPEVRPVPVRKVAAA